MEYSPIEQSFPVTFTYRLHFTKDLFSPGNSLLADILRDYLHNGPVKILFVVDQGVADHHPGLEDQVRTFCEQHSKVISFREFLIVEGGEAAKNSDEPLQKVLRGIDRNHICRHSFVIVIGGGAVIDMAGYAAAIAHRGVKLIRVPTTVLAQNDAAVGVKNGINYFGKKNFIGTFNVPVAIINDSRFLSTLDDRDWIAGIAEGIKVSLIKDRTFFEFIEKHASRLRARDPESMQALIYRCAELHMQHIARGGDPFESGSSRPLDFGHWAAHKLEHMTGYRLRHGEAVAIGMALDIIYSRRTGLLDEGSAERILHVLNEVGFDLRLPLRDEEEVEKLLRGIEEFREHLGGRLTITLLSEIGKKHDVHQIEENAMRLSVGELVAFKSTER